jgi:curli biogenesis system outer membrane secretion channel CsgG
MVPAAATGQAKPRVAVLAFENNSTFSFWGDRLGLAASDELTTQLVKSGQFSVVERQQVKALLDEQALGMSGAIDAATAARIGKLLGVQAVVLGSITQFSVQQRSGGIGRLSASFTEAESKVDARLVDTSTGEVLVVAEGDGKTRFGGARYKDMNLQNEFQEGVAQEALRPALEKVVASVLDQKDRFAAAAPAPTGQIVGVREGNIYVDKGENFGLKVGQRLEVVRVVDVIKDASGNVLDEITEKVGVIEVTRVLSQSAICTVVEGTPQDGDRVRLAAG